ncbi:MAG TPA: hypothetical protein VK141_01140 [Nitrosomonas sp.]|nr:hypothetical protein [Nitrosomonas sp.]
MPPCRYQYEYLLPQAEGIFGNSEEAQLAWGTTREATVARPVTQKRNDSENTSITLGAWLQIAEHTLNEQLLSALNGRHRNSFTELN